MHPRGVIREHHLAREQNNIWIQIKIPLQGNQRLINYTIWREVTESDGEIVKDSNIPHVQNDESYQNNDI